MAELAFRELLASPFKVEILVHRLLQAAGVLSISTLCESQSQQRIAYFVDTCMMLPVGSQATVLCLSRILWKGQRLSGRWTENTWATGHAA